MVLPAHGRSVAFCVMSVGLVTVTVAGMAVLVVIVMVVVVVVLIFALEHDARQPAAGRTRERLSGL